jgi:hypothetical protein
MNNKLKHLEFLQNLITRMNSNSFLLKAWTVTIVSALFAVSKKDSDYRFLVIVYISILAFWILDGYFLSQERQYRNLYRKVTKTDEVDIDFSINASEYNKGKNKWLNSMFSITLEIFYGCLILIVLIIKYLFN